MNKKIKILDISIYFFSFLVNILLCLVVFCHIARYGINYYFNSDALYNATIFKDIFIDGYSIKGWNLIPAPGILPDMVLYFVIMSIFKHPIYSSFVYSFIQYILFLFLLNKLINIISKQKNYLLNSMVNLTMSLFFLVYIFSKDFVFISSSMHSAFHFGAFIFAIIVLILTLKYLITQKNLFLVFIFIVASLAVFNDKLFIVIFSIPLFCSLIIFTNKNNIKIILKVLIVNIISIILGLVLFKLSSKIVNYSKLGNLIRFSNIKNSVKLFFETIDNFINDLSFHFIIIILSISAIILISYYLIKNMRKNFFSKENKIADIESIRYFYFLFFLTSSIITLFAPLLLGMYLDYSGIRYNIYSFYMLTFNFFPIIYFTYNNRSLVFLNRSLISYLYLLSAILLTSIYLIIFAKNFDKEGLREYFNYYPKCAACIDKYIEKNKNIYGISTYPIANVTLNFSKKNARLYSVYEDSFYPYTHINNSNWYVDNNGRYNKPSYTFIVTEKNKDFNSNIFKSYGQPIKTDTCYNYLIFTYPEFKFDQFHEPYFINLENKIKRRYFENFENESYLSNILITSKYAYSGKYSNVISKDRIYSYTYTIKFGEIKNLSPLKAVFNCKLFSDKEDIKANLVLSIEHGDKVVQYRNLSIHSSLSNLNEWKDFTLSINIPESLNDDALFKAYVWNTGTNNVYIDDLELYFY